MPRKEYLSAEARHRFDHPPILNGEQRFIFLQAPAWASQYVKGLLTPTNKVGFLLQVGYFRIVSRFFVSGRFHQADIDYIAGKISVDLNAIDMKDYQGTTFYRHQDEILAYFGFPLLSNYLVRPYYRKPNGWRTYRPGLT